MTLPTVDTVELWPAEVHRLVSGRPLAELTLPPEVRRALGEVVTRLLTDTPARDRYSARWRELSGRSPLPADVQEALNAVELKPEALCRNGVAALTDAELAALAASPDDLEMVAEIVLESIGTPGLGGVWTEPLDRAERNAFPETPPEVARRLTALARTLAERATTVPSEAVPPQRRRTYAPALAAAAAALLLGIGLGAGGHRLLSTGGRTDEWAALSTRSTVARVTPRGGDVSFELRLDSPRPGFAAVIVPRAGRPPLIYPEEWDDPPRVTPSGAATYGPLDAAAGQDVIVVITETPASDVLRRAFAKEPPGTGSADGVTERAETVLKAAGFRWAAFSRVTVR